MLHRVQDPAPATGRVSRGLADTLTRGADLAPRSPEGLCFWGVSRPPEAANSGKNAAAAGVPSCHEQCGPVHALWYGPFAETADGYRPFQFLYITPP
jgi:hypothetical protein